MEGAIIAIPARLAGLLPLIQLGAYSQPAMDDLHQGRQVDPVAGDAMAY
jgi:hypothetical protein